MDNSLRLEEYKTLRQEILQEMDLMQKNKATCLLVTTALLSYAFKEGNPLICLLAWLVNASFWQASYRHNKSTMMIRRYIAVFLEDMKNLAWENRVTQYYQEPHAVNRLWKINRIFYRLTIPYTTISFASMTGSLVMSVQRWLPQRWIRLATLGVLVLFILALHIMFVLKVLPRSHITNERVYWTQYFKKLRETEKYVRKDVSPVE